jgi:hypothetical protein
MFAPPQHLCGARLSAAASLLKILPVGTPAGRGRPHPTAAARPRGRPGPTTAAACTGPRPQGLTPLRSRRRRRCDSTDTRGYTKGCFRQRALHSLPAAEPKHAGARRIPDRSAPVPARAGSESEPGKGGHRDGGGGLAL